VSSGAGDPYLDPASGVLRNLLGNTDAAELARAEAALSALRLIDLERRRLPGQYDLAHLQAFHRRILGDVYAWAGQLGTVSIAKGIGVLPAAAPGVIRGGPGCGWTLTATRPPAPPPTTATWPRCGKCSTS
jgi:fido (protein-threonine AMPylation protein)